MGFSFLRMGILEILLTSFLHYRVFFSYENQVVKINLTIFFENFIHLLRNTVFKEVKKQEDIESSALGTR